MKKRNQQTFTNLKPVYKLNQKTKQLEMTEEVVDVDELVKSFEDVAIDKILSRLMPQEVVDQGVALVSSNQDKLDVMQEAYEYSQELKNKYGLSDNLTIEETFKAITLKNEEFKKLLSQKSKSKEVKQSEKEEDDKESK